MIFELGKQKKIAVLLDPENDNKNISVLVEESTKLGVDYFFVGGSIVTKPVDKFVEKIKKISNVPVVLFPGDYSQFTAKADALLYLSLISGRNPEYLINQHTKNSVFIKKSKIEVVSTGYILIDGGKITNVQKVSKTTAVSNNNIELVVSTAVAGELLGMKAIYLEAGSGAKNPVPSKMIQEVKNNIDIPLIVGGGLNSAEKIKNALNAGADLIVVGNHLETNPEKIFEFINAIKL